MKPKLLFALVALVGGALLDVRAQQVVSVAVASGTGATTVTPRWPVAANVAGLQFVAADLSLAGGGTSRFYTLAGTPISDGGDTAAFTMYVASSGSPTAHADIGSKLTPNSYTSLTFAEPNLPNLGAQNFYTVHRKGDGDHLTAIVPRAGTASTVTDLKQLSSGNNFLSLAFVATSVAGHGANQFYYLRRNPSTQASIFGVTDAAPAGVVLDKFTLGNGYNALTYADPNLGFGTQAFYYLRTDPVTGYSILGALNGATGSRVDIANLGSVFSSLTFVATDIFGPNIFFATGTPTAGAQSISFAALPDRQISDGAFAVAPTASSGLPIALTVVPGSIGSAAISGPVAGVFTVTPTAPGLITLQATQAGQATPVLVASNMLRQSFTASGVTVLAITAHPVSRSANIGANASFSVNAVGTTALSYQWRKDGVAITNNASATTATLNLINVQTTDYATYDVVVTNASGSITSNPAILSQPVAPSITSPTTASATVGTPFTYTITALFEPTNFGATGLPPGLLVDGNSGIISGIPAEAGTFTVSLRATNIIGSDLETLTLSIAPAPVAPTITSAAAATATVGVAFTFNVTAAGLPTSFTATSLPAGLSINGSTGAITGTPTTAGVFAVTVNAINAVGTGSGTLTITVVPAPVAPTITSATTATATVGIPFQYQITAAGLPTSFAATGLPGGLAVNPSTGIISGAAVIVGTYNVTLSASNAVGTGNATLTLTVIPAPAAPVITSSLALSGTVGSTFPAYFVTASGFPTSYGATGLPAGLGINPTNGGISGSPTAAGTFNVTLSATNAIGTGTATLVITIAPAPVPPNFSLQPASQSVAPGATVTFTANALGTPAPTYQWRFNGTAIPGATSASLTIPNAQTANAGSYTVVATNSAGTATSSAAVLSVAFSRIVNFSARAFSGLGAQTLIMGFNVSGNNKAILARGVGPALGAYGVGSPLVDPLLTLSTNGTGATTLAANDDWQISSNVAQFPSLFASVGAFAFPNGSKDAAIVTNLNAGAFDLSLFRPGGGTGIAMTEIYDLDQNLSARLTNVSARIQISLGEGVLIAGFVIEGNTPKTVLIRGVGPTLTNYGVGGVLLDPQLAVFAGPTLLGSNDDWNNNANAQQIAAAAVQVGAFPLPAASKDASVLLTLQPGNYSVQLTGVGNTTGVALIEVYDVQ